MTPHTRARRVTLRALLTAVALLIATLATFAVTARAAEAATLTATDGTATPEQNMAVSFTFAGTADVGTNSTLDAVARPASGAACGTSFEVDQADAASSDVFVASLDVPAGPYTHTNAFTPTAAGDWIVCAWLEQTTAGTTTVAATSSTPVTARGPQVAQLTVTPPTTITANQAFTVQYTTQTDQPLALYSVIHRTNVACGQSFEADRSTTPDAAVVVNGVSVDGGPVSTPGPITSVAGTFQLCTWLEVAGNQGVASGPVATPFTVHAPPSPAKPSPVLTLTSLSFAGGTVSFAGTTTAGYSGSISLVVQCASQVGSGQVTVGGGAYSGTLTLPAACTAGTAVKLTATIAASASFKGQTVSLAGTIPGSATGPPTKTGTKKPTTKKHKPAKKRARQKAKPASLPRLLVSSRRVGHTTTNVVSFKPDTFALDSIGLGTITVTKWSNWTRLGAEGHGTQRQGHVRHRISVTLGTPVHKRFACMALLRTVHGHQHATRLALAVGPHRQLQWVLATTLARHAKRLHLTAVAPKGACR
jgi:hypothetical protein